LQSVFDPAVYHHADAYTLIVSGSPSCDDYLVLQDFQLRIIVKSSFTTIKAEWMNPRKTEECSAFKVRLFWNKQTETDQQHASKSELCLDCLP